MILHYIQPLFSKGGTVFEIRAPTGANFNVYEKKKTFSVYVY